MRRYTCVTEVRGQRFDATYRGFVDVTIVRARAQCDWHATAWLAGGYPLADMSYSGYAWDEAKRLFKREVDAELDRIAGR